MQKVTFSFYIKIYAFIRSLLQDYSPDLLSCKENDKLECLEK